MLVLFSILVLTIIITDKTVTQKVLNQPTKPHVIIIVADDFVNNIKINLLKKIKRIVIYFCIQQGFNDIGFHGSNQIPTPNIDALAAFGITFDRFYTNPVCTPSRASLMTGKYAARLGMQHTFIENGHPFALGKNETLLPEYMQFAGYATHLIGKWHLGFYKREYTPIARGFDSFFGCLGPGIDNFWYNRSSGYDMYKNFDVDYENVGEYLPDLFTRKAVETIEHHSADRPLFLMLTHTGPLLSQNLTTNLHQVPSETLKKFEYISDVRRRKFAAMVSHIDESVGRLVTALHSANMINNSVILFMSDNGAMAYGELANYGSNLPLRGVSSIYSRANCQCSNNVN